MSKNKKLLEAIIAGKQTENGEPIEVVDNQEPIEVAPPAKTDDDIEIPKYEPKTKGRAPEESVAILRKQRDEARQSLAEKEALIAEKDAALAKANANGTIYDEVKKLIKKDDVTPEDLKTIFDDYDFTKKEKEALATQLKETQSRLRDYDIRQSSEFIDTYEKPIIEARTALAAEIVPIVNGKPITSQKAATVLSELIDSGEINAQTVKIAISKIRDAYEDEGVDYDMPSVKNVLGAINALISNHEKAAQAYNEWETVKTQKQLEKVEIDQSKASIIQSKSKQDRKVIAKTYLSDLASSDNYEYIAEMHGHENAMQIAVQSHNALSEMMDDPSKAPTYDVLLDLMTKAKLYDLVVADKAGSSKLALIEAKKIRMENLGGKPNGSAQKTDSNRELLRKAGVPVS